MAQHKPPSMDGRLDREEEIKRWRMTEMEQQAKERMVDRYNDGDERNKQEEQDGRTEGGLLWSGERREREIGSRN